MKTKGFLISFDFNGVWNVHYLVISSIFDQDFQKQMIIYNVQVDVIRVGGWKGSCLLKLRSNGLD